MKYLGRYFKKAIESINCHFLLVGWLTFEWWGWETVEEVYASLSIFLVKEKVKSFLWVREMGVERGEGVEYVIEGIQDKNDQNKEQTVLQCWRSNN